MAGKTESLFGDISSFLAGVDEVVTRGVGIFDKAIEPLRSAPLEPPPTVPTVPIKPVPIDLSGQRGIVIIGGLFLLYLLLR